MMSEPKFTQTGGVFTKTCAVEVNIQASPEIIWDLLTDAKGFPRWNTTVTSIEGHIREGERLRIKVPGTSRTFTPKVSDLSPGRRMIWSDGFAPIFRGVRTFRLEPRKDAATNFATTDFRMREHFSGVMFALVRSMLPDFGPLFKTYANDLKREAERVAIERPRSSSVLNTS